MEGLFIPGVTWAVVDASFTSPSGVMFGCTDPVQVLLHVVCYCEDDQLSVLSPCLRRFTVGTLQFFSWPHLHASLQHA